MVEFSKKSLAVQDTTLDKKNPDLYDGGSGYLLIGDKTEPKISLFRFQVSERPNYGDAELKYGTVGFYNLSTTSNSGSNFPHFVFYKMKSSPDGIDWGAGGSISPIKRGKSIPSADVSANTITVDNHQLKTGEPVTYTPFVEYYNDCWLGNNVAAEVQYYAIRMDNNTLKLSSTVALAIAGTADIEIGTTGTYSAAGTTCTITVSDGHNVAVGQVFPLNFTSYSSGSVPVDGTYTVAAVTNSTVFTVAITNIASGTRTGNVTAEPLSVNTPANYPALAVKSFGYLRSRKYRSDIHIVSAWGDNAESIAENFDGSTHRETNLSFEAVQRVLFRKGLPYITSPYQDKLWGNKASDYQSKTESALKDVYSDDDPTLGNVVWLASNKSNSDGSGWWKTTKKSWWHGGRDYVPKHVSGAPNPDVLFNNEKVTGTELYGNEVTPMNSFWHTVRGAKEVESGAAEEGGVNVLQATGAIRFSTEKKLTGGQSLNMYHFWKKDPEGTSYTSTSGIMNASFKADRKGQETLVQYKNIPMPNVTLSDTGQPPDFAHLDPTGQLPTSADAPSQGGDNVGTWTNLHAQDGMTMRIKISMNIDKLAKAFSTEYDATRDKVIVDRRAIFVCLSAEPVSKGESLYEFISRLGGANADSAGSWANNTDILASRTNNISSMGFWIVNTSLGLAVLPLGHETAAYSLHREITLKSSGTGTPRNLYYGKTTYGLHNSDATTAELNSARNGIISLGEDEWADWIISLSPNQIHGHLNIVSKDGMELYPQNVSNQAVHGGETDIANGLDLVNIGAAMSTVTNTYMKDPSTWPDNLSIWVVNSESNYKAGSYKGQDWFHDSENADMATNIFIDNIGISNVNLSHANSTLSEQSKDRIRISAGDILDASWSKEGLKFSSQKTSKGEISHPSNTFIMLGFEDPSQISSNYLNKKSHRYLYWQGYTSSNISVDAPIAWTAGGTLPKDTYALDANAVSGNDFWNRKWFNKPVQGVRHGAADWGDSAAVADNATIGPQYLDSGSPFVQSPSGTSWERHGSGGDNADGNAAAPAWVAAYSDAHVSLGQQFGNEAMNWRNLYWNKTERDITHGYLGGKIIKDGQLLEDEGGHGELQRMYINAPRIGIRFNASSGITTSTNSAAGEEIAPTAGSYGTTTHGWATGHKVVYYKAGGTTIAELESVDNTFKDTPVVYYVIRDGTIEAKFGLQTTLALAKAGVPMALTQGSSEEHIIYDYDYYVNKDYWITGWEGKGFSRLILQPTLDNDSNQITLRYIKNDGQGIGNNANEAVFPESSTHVPKLYLTKREHAACSAKVIEVLDRTSLTSTTPLADEGQAGTPTSIELRIDTAVPLYSTEGTTYRAYLVNQGTIVTGACPGETNTTNYKSGLSVKIINENTISIDNWNGHATATTGTKNLLSEDNLPFLWIGPEKYWVYFRIRNISGDTEASATSMPNKVYDNVCVVSPYGGDSATDATNEAWGVPGATFNESTANFERVGGMAAAYINRWRPEPNLKSTETVFDMADYGFGAPVKAEDGDGDALNGVRGGMVSKFVPRDNQINLVKLLQAFAVGEPKEEGDYLDLAMMAEDTSVDSTLMLSSVDNISLPKPFLLTVFEDAMPEPPTDFEVQPYEKDAFLPEFTWTAGDADLWYGFIMIDDVNITSQYHRSILHVPLNEDLRNVASSYDNTKGWLYASASSPVVYGYRYYNTAPVDSNRRPLNKLDASTWSTNFTLLNGGVEKITASEVKLYDNVEGLAGNTKYFDKDGGSYIEFPFNPVGSTGAALSAFAYPRDEMSVVVHVAPVSWADSGERAYIASFNELNDATATFDAWGMYMDDEGQVNAFVAAEPDDGTQSTFITLKSTTKLLTDGTPTCIILTVDTQLYSGNVKLFINGRLEDQSGLRGTLSTNNWPTDSSGMGGDAIFFDIDSTTCGLFIGAKSRLTSGLVGQSPFNGSIEEFVWYDKVIYPVTPQDGKFVLEKPLEELVSGITSSTSKSNTARLFIKDYHNIRGKTTGEVAASSQLSFKKAAFELNTVVV